MGGFPRNPDVLQQLASLHEQVRRLRTRLPDAGSGGGGAFTVEHTFQVDDAIAGVTPPAWIAHAGTYGAAGEEKQLVGVYGILEAGTATVNVLHNGVEVADLAVSVVEATEAVAPAVDLASGDRLLLTFESVVAAEGLSLTIVILHIPA